SLEWLADAQYTGKNNPNNLPAFTTFDAGVSANLISGTLTAAVSNFTDTYGGIFASPANAVPYVTQGGIAVPTIARPLTPRTYSITYAVKFGPGAQGTTHVGVSLSDRLEQREGAGGPNRRGGYRALPALPSSPPANPLDVTAASPLCTSEARTAAQNISSELKSYVAQIEAAKTAAGYPAAMPSTGFTDATVTYHGLGTTYALSIVPRSGSAQSATLASTLLGASAVTAQRARGRAFRSFFGCLPLHLAQSTDVAAAHLYAPATTAFATAQITFMPSVGLYVVARQQQAGQETFRLYALPSSPPRDPFAVRTSAAGCTSDLRNTAMEMLAQLRTYFINAKPPPGWTALPHQAKSGVWYSLVPGDASVVPSLLACARVAVVAPENIVGKGYDGVLPPALNYTKPFGLYLIRPQRAPQPSPAPSPPG
ncbi:MAG: hypothetical protein M3R35_06845, partial [Candidatus Eremiobacteraeota bacterium]|nr:hypothetical protein [Candidatus Eremiobacteraeota bacterium]